MSIPGAACLFNTEPKQFSIKSPGHLNLKSPKALKGCNIPRSRPPFMMWFGFSPGCSARILWTSALFPSWCSLVSLTGIQVSFSYITHAWSLAPLHLLLCFDKKKQLWKDPLPLSYFQYFQWGVECGRCWDLIHTTLRRPAKWKIWATWGRVDSSYLHRFTFDCEKSQQKRMC